jgi:hypothetical protein
MDVVSKIVKADGLLGLYAGLESTFWRHVLWNGGYFGCIFQVRALMPKAEVSGLATAAAAAGCGLPAAHERGRERGRGLEKQHDGWR